MRKESNGLGWSWRGGFKEIISRGVRELYIQTTDATKLKT